MEIMQLSSGHHEVSDCVAAYREENESHFKFQISTMPYLETFQCNHKTSETY